MKKALGERHGYGHILGLLLSVELMAGGGPALGHTRDGDENGRQLRINVRVYNYAQISDQDLGRGEKEAARIFRKTGVEVLWWNCYPATTDIHFHANCTPPMGPLNLVLRIFPDFAVVQGHTDGKIMGVAVGNLASISFRLVREKAAAVRRAPSQLLGLVIAHELGHLLLGPDSHSKTGIMRSRWDREDFQGDPLVSFAFTPDQAQRIHTEVTKRVQEHAGVELATATASE